MKGGINVTKTEGYVDILWKEHLNTQMPSYCLVSQAIIHLSSLKNLDLFLEEIKWKIPQDLEMGHSKKLVVIFGG